MTNFSFNINDIYINSKKPCGIDEVGRGCLAGPVVTACIVMPKGEFIEGVKDSKKLTPKKRELLYPKIIENSIAYGFGIIDNKIIDEINIRNATILAMEQALNNLKDKDGNKFIPDLVLIDALNIHTDIKQVSIIKGDDSVYEIACASIIAKVYRDHLMERQDEKYIGYNFAKHKGYGTKLYIESLKKLGASEIHRKSFLKNIL